MTDLKILRRYKETPWLKPVRNAVTLSLGRGAQGLFSLGYTALAAHGLGVRDFGALILIHSFALAVSQLARFQSWQALLRYGAKALNEGDIPQFQHVLKFCLILDAISVVIALAIMLPGSGPAARLFGLPPDIVPLARLYGFGVVFVNLGSAPSGVLRLLDRFDLLSIQSVVEPATRLAGVAALFCLSAGLEAYLIVWFGALIAGKIALNLLAWRALRQRDLLHSFASRMRRIEKLSPAPGAWRFVTGTNISSSLGLASTQLPTLMVGWLLGPSGAGIFKIGQQFAGVLTKTTNKLLVPAIYTDLSHLTAAGHDAERRRLVLRNCALAGGAGLTLFSILLLFGRPLIIAFAGRDFLAAYGLTLWLAFAGIPDALFFPLEPLLIAAGKIKETTYIRLASTIVYLGLLYLLLPRLGVNGAGMAMIGFEIAGGALLVAASRQTLQAQES